MDLVLGRVPDWRRHDDLDAEVLYHDRVFVATGAKAPWARRRRIALADLMEHRWLLFPEKSWIDMRVTEGFRRAGVAPPQSIVRAYSVHFCISMLGTDRFSASLAGSVLRFNSPRFGLKVLPVDFPAQPWPVAMVTLKGRTVSPVVEKFMEDVRAVAEPIARQRA